jgi:mono/diheme cytochrome c family protein
MTRIWRPLVVGALIALGVFVLAKAQIFEPSASSGDPSASGDADRGAVVFERACAACHGTGGEGGSGPRLVGSGLDRDAVTEQVRQGSGVMPGGLVTGQDEADVVAYVVSIAGP